MCIEQIFEQNIFDREQGSKSCLENCLVVVVVLLVLGVLVVQCFLN